MKAAINERYGGPEVVEIRETPTPELGPGPNREFHETDVLVRVHATTVNRTDCGMRTPYPFFARPFIGLFKPNQRILGLDFAGVVEAVGGDVTFFAVGDRVFGLSPSTYGAHAEVLRVPQDGPIAKMPKGIDFSAAAPIEGAWYATNILRKFGLSSGHSLLVYGATGAIGTAAVQLAKAKGATVTAVCPTKNVDLTHSLGADRVIDYQSEDFTAIGETFDFVLDAVGKTSYFDCRKLLKPGGVYSATDFGRWGHVIFLAILSAITRSGRVIFAFPSARKTFIEFLRDRIETGEYRAVIDRRYPLDEIVEAYRYVETEQKVGNVVIEMAGDG